MKTCDKGHELKRCDMSNYNQKQDLGLNIG